MNSQPTYDNLIAYAAGDLPKPQADAVEVYLAGHPDAAATVARYRTVNGLATADDSVEPPAHVLARAKALFTLKTATPWQGWLEAADALVARLVFDSRVQTAAVRRGHGDAAFQLAFEVEDAEIDLTVTRLATQNVSDQARWRVVGQVAADDETEPWPVAVYAHGQEDPAVRTMTDEQGMFDLELTAGSYDLMIERGGRPLVLPTIDVR